MNQMIVVKDFVKRYGNFTAVDHVSFEVEEGSVFAFLGPNGAGKSTVINTLCTIIDKTTGTLLIDGKDVSRDKEGVRNVIGVVFQDSTLDSKMTVEENLKMHCFFYGLKRAQMGERINFVLNIVDLDLWKKALVGTLSGGMKRRVEIARSLLHFPKVLFLDEPTTGLDPQTRANIWDYILRLQKEQHMTIFLTTHYMDEAEICDKVAVIDQGKMIAFDTPDTLKKSHTTDKAKIISLDPQGLQALVEKYKMSYTIKKDSFSIDVEDLSCFMEMVSEHKRFIRSLEIKKSTLNEVFLELTGRDIREGVGKCV